MSGIQLPSALGAIPKAPERYDRANEDAFRRGVEQALQIMKSASITGLKSSDIPNPLILGTDPGSIDANDRLRAGGRIYVGGAAAEFSFADRTNGAAHRWVWYADSNIARLYSAAAGTDILLIDEATHNVTLPINGRSLIFTGGASFYNSVIMGTGNVQIVGGNSVDQSLYLDAGNASGLINFRTGAGLTTRWQILNAGYFRMAGSSFGALGLKADWNAVDGIGFENSGAGTYDIWRIGPGAGNGQNAFNWYNHTASAVRFIIKSAGGAIVGPAAGSGNGGFFDVAGSISGGGSVNISSSANTNVGDPSNSSLFILRDSVNGGTALILVDNTGTKDVIVSQLGTTVFTTAAPTAAQIQIGVGAGNQLQLLGGSSRNGTTVRWTQIRTQ